MAENRPISIETQRPIGERHEMVDPRVLEGISMSLESRNRMIPLFEYLGKHVKDGSLKPRGQEGGEKDLNSHRESFIVKEGSEVKIRDLSELQEMLNLAGFNAEILAVNEVGNDNQKVTSVVQGVNADNPKSGYERPVVSEGPHMIIAPYAYDKQGKLHVFRTIQHRTGSAGVDTPRGFLDAQTLASGKHIYKVEGSGQKVQQNLMRIVKEEGGEKLLQIKGISYLGSHVVNKSFVVSPSALFGVEVDYEEFSKLKNVVNAQEATRRRSQMQHEALTDIIIDMTPEQYVYYKTSPDISKDLAADSATDIIMMSHLLQNQRQNSSTGELPKAA